MDESLNYALTIEFAIAWCFTCGLAIIEVKNGRTLKWKDRDWEGSKEWSEKTTIARLRADHYEVYGALLLGYSCRSFRFWKYGSFSASRQLMFKVSYPLSRWSESFFDPHSACGS